MVGTLDDYTACKLTDLTKNGECSGCGQCCTNWLALSQREIDTIRRYVKKHNIKEQIHRPPTSSDVLIDMTCPFLNTDRTDKKCMIYPVRPQLCKSFICNRKDYDAELFKEPREALGMRETFFNKKGDSTWQ